MRKILRLVSLLLAFYCVERFCHDKTDGFALVNIVSSAPIATSNQACLEDHNILNQKFFYSACGAQSYVFVSEDGKSVLKFFKQQHMRIPPWLEVIWLPKPLAERRAAKIAKKRRDKETLFKSIEIAQHLMKESTGLIYVHLQKSDHLKQEVTLVDKIGIAHKLNLDEYEFYLQKRATLAYDYIAHNPESSDRAIQSLIELSKERCLLQIRDKDPDFATNFGFIGDQAIQIDIGRFSMADGPIDQPSEMMRITRAFRAWLMEKNPLWAHNLDKYLMECNG